MTLGDIVTIGSGSRVKPTSAQVWDRVRGTTRAACACCIGHQGECRHVAEAHTCPECGLPCTCLGCSADAEHAVEGWPA